MAELKVGDRVRWPGGPEGVVKSVHYEDFPAFREPQQVATVHTGYRQVTMRGVHFERIDEQEAGR